MKRNCVALALLAALVVWLASSRAGDGDFKSLFNGKNFEGWKFELGKADPEKTFKVKDGIIVVSGNPNGYSTPTRATRTTSYALTGATNGPRVLKTMRNSAATADFWSTSRNRTKFGPSASKSRA
jgi:hypothetical protein